MKSRKTRDAKFIIYQTLYIFVIGIFAIQGAHLGLKKLVEINKNEIVITKDSIDILKKNNTHLDPNETKINKDSLEQLVIDANKKVEPTKVIIKNVGERRPKTTNDLPQSNFQGGETRDK